MQLHFHFCRVPITLTIGKKGRRERELTECMNVLAIYSLLPRNGQLARWVLRKQARP